MISDKLKRNYVPMTESAFYILFSLQSPQHGYGIGQNVKSLTNDEVKIGPGTMYGSLSKMERDGLIQFVGEEEKRKIYVITELGKEILDIEKQRIARLYRNSRGE